MILKLADSAAVKAGRGLYLDAAYGLRPGLLDASRFGVLRNLPYALAAGQESEVLVKTDLTPNASVSRVQAKLVVGQPLEEAQLPTTSVSVKHGPAPADTFELSVEPPRGPSNLTVRLDQGEVFWSQSGPSSGSYDLPDFSEQLNTYLDKLKSDGEVSLRFLVRSDTAGSASISITSVDYTVLQTQTWTNDLDATVRVDRNVDVSFGTETQIPLDAQKGDGGLKLTRVAVDLSGKIGPERLYGGLPTYDGREMATVDANFSLAQSWQLDIGIKCAGVCALLRPEAACEVYVELQPAGAIGPATGAALASGKLKLAAATSDATAPTWQYVLLEKPADLQGDTEYWAVLKAVSGRAFVALQAGAPAHLDEARVHRGGQLWREAGGGCALVSPVYLPTPDTQTAAVEASLVGAPARRVDPEATPTEVSLDVTGALLPAKLVLRSYGRGALRIANVVQEFGR